jgi:hypothetical protein
MARPSGTKNIKTPQKMWDIFCAYKQKIKSNPIIVEDWVGGMGKKVRRKKERPLTLEGFENYCFENGIITDVSHYFCNLDDRYKDYVGICSRIRQIIREDQIAGGMAGIYNPSITQRLNGLTEKIQDDGTKEIKITVTRGNRQKTE